MSGSNRTGRRRRLRFRFPYQQRLCCCCFFLIIIILFWCAGIATDGTVAAYRQESSWRFRFHQRRRIVRIVQRFGKVSSVIFVLQNPVPVAVCCTPCVTDSIRRFRRADKTVSDLSMDEDSSSSEEGEKDSSSDSSCSDSESNDEKKDDLPAVSPPRQEEQEEEQPRWYLKNFLKKSTPDTNNTTRTSQQVSASPIVSSLTLVSRPKIGSDIRQHSPP